MAIKYEINRELLDERIRKKCLAQHKTFVMS